MKLFISKGFIFIAILLSYFFCNYKINKFFIDLYPPKLNATTLIMGDSHTLNGIDPSAFSNARNIASPNEPYLSTYFKLSYLHRLYKIDTILLGFSPHNISDFNEKKFIDPAMSRNLFEWMYPMTSIKQFQGVEFNKFSYARVLVKSMFLFPKKSHFYLRNFVKRTEKLNQTQKTPMSTIKRHFSYRGKNSKISSLSIAYLDSIIQIAERNKIKIILVNMPLHARYRKLIPKDFQVGFEKHKVMLQQNGIQVIDYSEFQLADDYFMDYDHVNYKGAKVISSKLKKSISKNVPTMPQ